MTRRENTTLAIMLFSLFALIGLFVYGYMNELEQTEEVSETRQGESK